jgi:hypothetical protein
MRPNAVTSRLRMRCLAPSTPNYISLRSTNWHVASRETGFRDGKCRSTPVEALLFLRVLYGFAIFKFFNVRETPEGRILRPSSSADNPTINPGWEKSCATLYF